MDEAIKVDRSLARGSMRQELRQNPGLLSLNFSEADAVTLEGQILEKVFGLAVGPKKRFPNPVLKTLAREVRRLSLIDCEEFYHTAVKTVDGSTRRSFFETSYRSRPVNDPHDYFLRDGFIHVRKDCVTWIQRIFPVSITVHAIERYIQRGHGVDLSGRNVQSVLTSLADEAGLFSLLAMVAGSWNENRFAVPFREGLALCESHALNAPFICKVDGGELYRTTKSLARLHGHHGVFHLGGQDGPGGVHVNTYVGRSEMKHGQVAFHEAVARIREKARPEIALLGRINGLFYPGQDPELERAFAKSIPKLDWAVREIASCLAGNRWMSYAFNKEELFSPRSVALPSSGMATQEKYDRLMATLMEAGGFKGMNGGLACHAGPGGVPGYPQVASIYDGEMAAEAAGSEPEPLPPYRKSAR